MIKSLILSFFLTNISFAFCLIFLVVLFLLPGKTSFQPKPQSVSSSVIPDFNKGIVVTLLIHIYTLSLPMSHFFTNLLCSLPPLPTFGVLSLSLFFPFWIPYLHLQHPLDHCSFIPAIRVLILSLHLTHLLWCLPPRCQSCLLPMIFPLPFRKVLVHLVTLILFITFRLITAYFH